MKNHIILNEMKQKMNYKGKTNQNYLFKLNLNFNENEKEEEKKTCLQSKTMRTNPNPCYDKQIERNKKQLLNGTLFLDSFMFVTYFTLPTTIQAMVGTVNVTKKSFSSKCEGGDGLEF